MPDLTVREHMTIRLAAETLTPLARHARAQRELGLSPVRFAQLVAVLLDRPEVETAYPREVRRLRRIRDGRRALRSAARVA